ncbi:choline/glycine/proline betaine transport protein [Lewinella marina]|uniref:Choline transporter n=1 Tax=Neolewinella marina TaxID=438751 RepID=A0A2G0CC63_9BACT|nr:BCCT family transporter [Neolewinella marina]NJB86758.1 choline/glycine/proline betaine transport protein [Neolewinella marina]PHK97563.1 choline transporter [Neolewinella marina]
MVGKDKQENPTPTEGLKETKKLFDIHGPVFWPAAVIIVLFIAVTLVVGEPMKQVFADIQEGISGFAGSFFVLLVNLFLFFTLYLAFSRFGKIRLGGKNAEPEFSTLAWFAMLFSAGMGIGILFWSVAEPIYHFQSPPISGVGETREAAIEAMGFTYLHWGLHAWGIYALVGMALAFFSYNRKLPLTIRSVFYPILGKRIYGWPGNLIDVLAVVATLFGLATSLGLGVKQVNAGLNYLFGITDSPLTQVILIGIITVMATASVVLGIDKGVRVLSEWNIRIAAVFLLFMIILGPTLFIVDSFTQNTGYYLQNFFTLGFWTESYQQSDWQNSWTVFYWAWWISWSPFVGMFIGRISRGRTVREFVLGVLIVPTILTFLWLSAFGGSAILLELTGSDVISAAVTDNVATALFVLLEQYPFSFVTSLVGVLLVTSFFVTSSDSGSLVIDSITSGGKLDAPVGQRVFWAFTEGGVAAVLLIGGGLGALQTAAITTGLPFALVLLVMCYSLYRGLKTELLQEEELQKEKDKRGYEKTLSDLVTRHQKKKAETNKQE